MTELSENFTLEELTCTETGLPNQPDGEVMDNLRRTARQMEAVRGLMGHPIIVRSGYRSPAVNEADGGAKNSAHMQGYAVDFVCPEYGTPLEVADRLAGSSIKFDQVIRENRGQNPDGGWVHISFAPAMRQMLLTKRSADAPYEHGINA